MVFFLLAFILNCIKNLKSDENVPLIVSLYKREKEIRRREFEEKIRMKNRDENNENSEMSIILASTEEIRKKKK